MMTYTKPSTHKHTVAATHVEVLCLGDSVQDVWRLDLRRQLRQLAHTEAGERAVLDFPLPAFGDRVAQVLQTGACM